MFTTGDVKLPGQRTSPDDEVWAPYNLTAGFCCGDGEPDWYAYNSSSKGSNQASSPNTSGICGRAHIGHFLAGQSSYHGTGDDPEADFDEGSTERMESLVSGLLQDEGREDPEVQENMALRYGEFACVIERERTDMEARRYGEIAYVVQRERVDMEARNREYSTELQVMSAMEATKEHNVCGYSAADLGKLAKRKTLSNQKDLVEDLRAIAISIAQSSLFERNVLERTNEALVGYCERLYRQDCPTSGAELDMVNNARRELDLMRSLALNLESIQSCSAACHVESRRMSGPCCLSRGPTIVSNSPGRPAPVISSGNSPAADVRSVVSWPPSGGQKQETLRNRSRSTPERKPDGYLGNFNMLPKLQTSSYNEAGAVQASLGADMDVIPVAVTGFHQNTPTRVCPRTCNQNGSGKIASVCGSKNECHSYPILLPGQKGFKYYVAFGGQDDGSSDDNSALLRTNPKKALIAQGGNSISILLKPENSASRERSCYPAASFLRGGSAPVSKGLPMSLSPIRRRRFSKSGPNVAVQLMPVQRPLLELDVFNQGQFKTELCKNWKAEQCCRYGDLCRFAHGAEELRCVLRHPRYKTTPCRMVMQGKVCIYGDRCHFRHILSTEEELSLISVIDVHEVSVH